MMTGANNAISDSARSLSDGVVRQRLALVRLPSAATVGPGRCRTVGGEGRGLGRSLGSGEQQQRRVGVPIGQPSGKEEASQPNSAAPASP